MRIQILQKYYKYVKNKKKKFVYDKIYTRKLAYCDILYLITTMNFRGIFLN